MTKDNSANNGNSQLNAPKKSEAWAEAEDQIDAPLFGSGEEASEDVHSEPEQDVFSSDDLGGDLFSGDDLASLTDLGLSNIHDEDEPFADRDLHAFGQPLTLDAPKTRPGFVQRWVLYSIEGKPYVKGISKAQRKGWVPRVDFSGIDWTGFNRRKLYGKTVMESMGHVLCEMPEKLAMKYRRQNALAAQRLTEAAEVNLHNQGQNGGVPVRYSDQTHAEYGRRRVPHVADDKGL